MLFSRRQRNFRESVEVPFSFVPFVLFLIGGANQYWNTPVMNFRNKNKNEEKKDLTISLILVSLPCVRILLDKKEKSYKDI